MKVASIVPIANIDRTCDGDYAMMLTHLANYYPKVEGRRQQCYRIMDNSLIELGNAASVERTFEAATVCEANEIVLPDVFCNCDETLREVEHSLDWLYSKREEKTFRLMAVCQGKNEFELARCYEKLQSYGELYCIGIPKVADKLHPLGRPGFEALWEYSKKQIHLLGCWFSLTELKQYEHPELIRSCDTCIPAILARDMIENVWTPRPKRTIDFFKDDIPALSPYDLLLSQLKEAKFL